MLSILERTLDDSANRRLFLPQAFLALDEVLSTAQKVVSGMNVHEAAIRRNLESYGVFAATERLLMELGRRGADRQVLALFCRVVYNVVYIWGGMVHAAHRF